MKNEPSKGFTVFTDLPNVDPAVESILGQGQIRKIESHLPQKERARKKKDREHAQKRIPHRIGLDLPVDLKNRLEDLAKREGVPVSQLVAFLLYEPVLLLEQNRSSLWGYKSASRSPKYESNLDLIRRSEEASQNR